MSDPEAALRSCWRRITGVERLDLIEPVLARLREPHRRYHTATHVMFVLRDVDELLAVATQPVDADAVRAAALFHDAVYDPRSTTNEHDSAGLSRTVLGEAGWAPHRTDEVATMIEATTHRAATGPTDDAAAAILLDADLAILGGEPSVYDAYVTRVRGEYGHVDAAAWRAGRSAVLRGFLARPTIYRTPTMSAAREHRARANIAAELAALEGG